MKCENSFGCRCYNMGCRSRVFIGTFKLLILKRSIEITSTKQTRLYSKRKIVNRATNTSPWISTSTPGRSRSTSRLHLFEIAGLEYIIPRPEPSGLPPSSRGGSRMPLVCRLLFLPPSSRKNVHACSIKCALQVMTLVQKIRRMR